MIVLCQDRFCLMENNYFFEKAHFKVLIWKMGWLQFLALIMGSDWLRFESVKLDKLQLWLVSLGLIC